MGGQCDDDHVAGCRVGLQRSRRLEPIHPWQTEIHQDEIRRVLLGKAQARFGGLCGDDLKTLSFQQVGSQLEVERIIFYDQYCGHQFYAAAGLSAEESTRSTSLINLWCSVFPTKAWTWCPQRLRCSSVTSAPV